MSGSPTRRPSAPLVLAVVLALGSVAVSVAVPAAEATARSGWTGSIDLYRAGTFTTQRSWLWCTAADVQIIRNIARRETDHAKASQRRYFAYMRNHNRYDIPVGDGVDPAGWAAGLRHYVDRRYRLTVSTSFDAALRSAVTNLRRTNLPVGITVAHGNHAWVLTGFSATADPASTRDFKVTRVRVVGSLWGLQSRTYGYDMRPNTELTTKQFRGFFTRWHYAGVRMAWEGRWVSVQPIAAAMPEATQTSKPTRVPTPTPTRTPPPTPTPTPIPTSTSTPGHIAVAAPTADAVRPSATPPVTSTAGVSTGLVPVPRILALAILVAGFLTAAAIGWTSRRMRRRR